MSNRDTLNRMNDRLAESMGVRPEAGNANLAPQPAAKDIGRRPLRNAGKLAIDKVLPDPRQPRVEFDADGIERLAQSIRDKGQLSPIHVRWSESQGKWLIIAGERRYRAAVRAGLPSIDCYFREGELTESEILEQQLIENLLREDLQPIEEAHAFEKLIQLNDWSSKQLAESLHIPASKVTRSLALLKLPRDLQQQVMDGSLPARAAYELSKLPTATSQRDVLEQAAVDGLTTRQVAAAVRKKKGRKRSQPKGTRLVFPVSGGWTVTITAANKGTYYEIEQAVQEVLDEVRLRLDNNVQIF